MPSKNPKPHPRADAAARFHGTRQAHRDETGEDYVEAIAQIIAERGEARVRDLARLMGVSHVTVSRIVGRLARADRPLVTTAPYQPIRLTRAGARLAARARSRHEVVLAFLEAIGVPPHQAAIDAEGIEHHVSQATITAMRRVVESSRRAP